MSNNIVIVCFVSFLLLNVVEPLKSDINVEIINDGERINALAKTTNSNVLIAGVSLSLDGNKTGWNLLDTWTNETYSNEETAYWLGVCEGAASKNLIYEYWYNTVSNFCKGQEKICAHIEGFIKENNDWVFNMITKYKDRSSYWWQVNLIYKQLLGLFHGYNKHKSKELPTLSYEDFLFMNMRGDLYDLVDKFKPKGSPPSKIYDDGHCSAIVKILPDYEDIYVAHTTWTKYSSMTRIAKRYRYNHQEAITKNDLIPGKEIVMSSYPGVMLSIDDFYVTSAQLAIQETTTGNFNENLWKYVNPNNTIFNFVRVQVANRLASSGKSWSKLYAKYNSGTYNNQWMVIDYKKFIARNRPQKDLLWVLEQIPGQVEAMDQTEILINQGYWASYNVPYYKNIFNKSGFKELVEKYGKWYSYEDAPRANIMKRDHKKIKSMTSLMTFIRSNDYKNDPLSLCDCTPPSNAALAVASRKDLNPANGIYPVPFLGHAAQGATDAKCVNSSIVKQQMFVGIVGPTTGRNLPPFIWSKSDFNETVLHKGQPDEFNFKPLLINFNSLEFLLNYKP